MLTQQQTLRWIALPLLLATFSGAQNKILWARDELPLSSEGLAHRISRLIEQLGDDRYTTRERAQAELAKLGFEAFEALSEAQSHQEIEIAQRAKYLILSMRINWTWDEDPPAVKTILKGYEQQGNDRRVMSMNALAQLEDGQGIEALCRLARFERTDELSKQAAMLVIANAPREKKERVRHRTTIRTTLGPSKRPGTLWLRVYADWLHEPAAALDAWDRVVSDERQLLQEHPERSSPRIVRNLLRRQAEMLRHSEREELAMAVSRRLFEHLDADNQIQLLEIADWLVEQRAWYLILELSGRVPIAFEKNALLAYRMAQAHEELGETAAAHRKAQETLQRSDEDAKQHRLIALELRRRGLLKWSEWEYRHVIQLGPVGSMTFEEANIELADMLHDITRDLPAARVLEEFLRSLEDLRDDPPDEKQMSREEFLLHTSRHRARMHFYFSQHYSSSTDRDRQRQHLEKAIAMDRTDADVLIAMYRFPDQDKAWRKHTRVLIEEATLTFRELIKVSSDDVTLANLYNQLAWLVGNTVGDYDEALQCSQRSLEIRPNLAGYLDTLARCYYVKGDLDNALKVQAQAVRLEPYSGQIKRQLELFQSEQRPRPSKVDHVE